MQRRRRASLVLIVLALSVGSPLSAATASTVVRADLSGMPIGLADVGKLHCHDLAFPAIHCYATESDLRSAIAFHSDFRGAAPRGPAAVAYIELFASPNYLGGSISLSANYANLGTIGWNDLASSYWPFNNLNSQLSVNTNYTGSSLFPCCNQPLPSFTSTFDNAISSARRI